MKVEKTDIEGVFIIEPKVWEDNRGFFLETFQLNRYRQELGIDLEFIQDNHSRSTEGVLRGLHFQKKKPQGLYESILHAAKTAFGALVFKRISEWIRERY